MASASSRLGLLALAAVFLFAAAGTVSAVPVTVDTTLSFGLPEVNVGLFSAYNAEYSKQITLLTGSKKNYTIGGRLYTTGKIGNKTVVVTMSGIGMTNAAMTVQAMILLFNPKYILMSGIAGGIDPSVRIGDVVIPKAWINPQLQKFIRPLYENGTKTSYYEDNALDFPDKYYTEAGKTPGDFGVTLPGQTGCGLPDPANETLAELAAAGATVSKGLSIPIEVELLVEKSDTFAVPTPPTKFDLPISNVILNTATKVLKTVNLTRTSGAASLPYMPVGKIVERGMSSNTFLDNPDYRKSMYDMYGPSCVEMEGHAAMQVCISNKVHCAVVRSISDLAGGEPGQQGENEIGVFFAVAAANTAKVAVAIIKALP